MHSVKDVSAKLKLDLESGNLPTWSDHESSRLSRLATMRPGRWTGIGGAAIYKRLRKTLRDAGLTGNWMEDVARDIVDMAQLKSRATIAKATKL